MSGERKESENNHRVHPTPTGNNEVHSNGSHKIKPTGNHQVHSPGGYKVDTNDKSATSTGQCTSDVSGYGSINTNGTISPRSAAGLTRLRRKLAVRSSNSDTPTKDKSSLTYNLVSYTSLPLFLNDNEFLLHGHRPVLNSATECLKSVFRIHTETWNIWTHLLGHSVHL